MLLDTVTRDTIERVGLRGERVEGTLVLEGDGTHLSPRQARNRSALRLVDCHDVTVSVSVQGPHAGAGTSSAAYVEALEAQHAFELIGCSNITLAGSSASYVYGDFVYLDRQPREIVVEDCDFHHNGRQAFGVASVSGLRVRNCRIDMVRRAVFDLEPHGPDQLIERVRVRDVTVGSHRLKFLACAGRGNVRDVAFHRVQATSPLDVLVVSDPPSVSEAHRYSNFTFSDCSSTKPYGSSAGRLMQFTRVDGVTVRALDHPLSTRRPMVHVQTEDCSGVSVGPDVTSRVVA